ncbi:MAG: GNAT family N-acetyltransferase [Myxococcales bacterium]
MSAEGPARLGFRELGARLVAPTSKARDLDGSFDRALWRELGAAGLFQVSATPARGLRQAVEALEGLAEGSCDLGLSTSVLAHLVCCDILSRYGTAEQRAGWLPRLLSGEWVGAVANAEPGAGTDILGLRTRAAAARDGTVLRGRKRSITNLGAADLVLVSARLEGAESHQSINAFGLALPRAGAHVRPIRDLLGLRTSPTGNLLLRSARIPPDARVGAPGQGVEIFRRTFALERLLAGGLYLAALRITLDRAVSFAERREQFGRPVGRNQFVQERIVRVRVAEELLRSLLTQVTGAFERSEEVSGALSVIKLHGLEAALEGAQGLLRILGSRGVRRAEVAERLIRDLLALSIFGGTVELHKIVAYNETVRQHLGPAAPPSIAVPTPEGVSLELVETARLTAAETAELVTLVAEALPGQPALRGRYYYDSPPQQLVLARGRGRILGVRILVHRVVRIGDREVRVAGTGIAVRPEAQRQGLGSALTARALAELSAAGVDLVAAFLLPRSSDGLLRRFGFRPLAARVTHLTCDGELTVERAACHALELKPGALLEAIESAGELHLGTGTW